MTEATYTKLAIAQEYLNTAMELYVEKRNYFCVMHLAGAAEELFGKHLPKEERIYTAALKAQIGLQVLGGGKEIEYTTAQETEKKAANKIVSGNKNAIKHINDGSDISVTLDPVYEARYYIDHALINLRKLNLPKPRTYSRFVSFTNIEDRR